MVGVGFNPRIKTQTTPRVAWRRLTSPVNPLGRVPSSGIRLGFSTGWQGLKARNITAWVVASQRAEAQVNARQKVIEVWLPTRSASQFSAN